MRPHYKLSIYQKKYKTPQTTLEVEELNLTSLMDVLIILLFFLLMSYNPSVLEINTPEGVNPPFSESLELGTDAVIFQVNVDKDVYYGKDVIGNVENEADDAKIVEILTKAFEEQKARFVKKYGEKTEAYKNINYILDSKLTYGAMEQIMRLSSMAGFDNYKFVVRSKAIKE